MNYSRSNAMDTKDVEKLGTSKYPAIMNVVITKAITTFNPETGSDCLELYIRECGKEDAREIKLDKIYIGSGKDSPFIKENKKWAGNLLYLLNPQKPSGEEWEVGTMAVEQHNWDTGQDEIVEKDAYVEFQNIPVKAIVTLYKKLKRGKINGYTGRPLPSYKENKEAWELANKSPETIEFPTFAKDDSGNLRYDFIYKADFYDVETGQNLFERNHDKDAEDIEKKMAYYQTRAWTEDAPKEFKDQIEMRKQALIKALKKAGKDFDETRWNAEPRNNALGDTTFDASEDVPF